MAARRRRSRRTRRAELSQHFLRAASASRLVQKTSITSTDLVIEIGPGRGALTKILCRQTSRLIAVELDPYLAAKLRHDCNLDASQIVEQDFLEFSLPEVPYSVIGNIPYNHATDIIRKLTFASNPADDLWLVVQQELAYRMCGLPFQTENLWSLRLKPMWHLEIRDYLGRKEFDPPPAVDSVFLHLSHRTRPIVAPEAYPIYLNMLEVAFTRNTRMKNALKPLLTGRQIRRLASELRFSIDDRPVDLMFEQWLGLFRYVHRLNRKS